MRLDDYQILLADVKQAILGGARSIGVLGLTRVTLQLLDSLAPLGLSSAVEAIYVSRDPKHANLGVPVEIRPVEALREFEHDVLVVADDNNKEELLLSALPFVRGTPKVIVSGYGHLQFRDAALDDELAQLVVPSLANGYPNTLTHLYQCLRNAARLKLTGVVAEFGMFKGGTTMLLSRLIERLGQTWQVIGFDTFTGFPPRRSILDMYDHPDCVFTDIDAVKRYLDGRNVEIVPGDIVETSKRLLSEDLVLSFIDTDNYTSAKAALDVVQERTVIGGAIVFDHYTGTNRFRYTLGERMAGHRLAEDTRYFHLHDTGVFYRQR